MLLTRSRQTERHVCGSRKTGNALIGLILRISIREVISGLRLNGLAHVHWGGRGLHRLLIGAKRLIRRLRTRGGPRKS